MKSKMDFIPVYCSMADIAMLLKKAEGELNRNKNKEDWTTLNLTQELLEKILVEHYGFDDKYVVYNEELDCMTFYSTMTCLHRPRESNAAVNCQRFDGKERADKDWINSDRCSIEQWFAVKG